MTTNGIDRIQIGVRNLAASVAFFRDLFEMSVVAEAPIDASGFCALWNLPASVIIKAVYLKNSEQPTAIELLEVMPNDTGVCIREGARLYDYGLIDVAFRAKGIAEIYPDLLAKGYTFHSKPAVYTADWANVTVCEVIMSGPDGMPVALIERLSEPKPVIKNRFGTMIDVAQYVPDIDACLPFYTDVLGYTCVFDKPLPDGLVDPVIGLPPGTHSRLSFLLKSGTATPAVEFIQSSIGGQSLAPRTGPTSFGLFSMAFETPNLEALLRTIREAGFDTIGGPVQMTSPLHGPITAAVVRGPNQVLLEFFSRR
jgi:catechol 2,3-dioxygenase-like lactoylglutathione lyase family enzyme